MPAHSDNVVPFPSPPERPLDLGELFDRHGAFVTRVAHRLTGRADLAEDLAQEVFLIAWNKREELVHTDGIRTWLYRVTVNLARTRKRSENRYGAVLERFKRVLDPFTATPEQTVSAQRQGDRVHATVAKLSPKQREVFVLYELEELEGAEIAAILGISVNTVWSRLRLARAAFKTHWEAT